ncbi:Clp protease ClpP [Rhizobium sp. CFBP 8762]|uniref:head maturation protease, ClpP-related n=1 Tax=Rhizobium sp. CFBP 8762 TaxID=2775279 RepID=UPI00177B216E|nr:head maturation protease, ClpP-related [Rhizobium sp. CFBP 8762]MBD8556899.1 Clp protease ClpP [Rhizobium sp. CFBP 8762]
MAVLVNGELVLYGFVGDNYWDQGFTSREVIDALAEIGRDTDVNVRINSGGGYVDDGVAIFNALSQHKGKVTVIVDAMAASSASIIAMAGEERIMRKGAMMMIHDPASVVWGTADDMAKAVKMLEKHAVSFASIYADVTGEDIDDIRADMKDELWLTADEAVERAFATSANDNKAKPAAAHDYSVYAKAPQRFVALAGKKNWSHTGAENRALASTTAANPSKQENRSMANDKPAVTSDADADKAVATATKDRIKAIMNCDDAKGREALANHFAFETDMTPDAAIAALKLAAPATATTPPEPTYEERRLAAAALAQPGGGGGGTQSKPAANLNASEIYARRNMKGA